MLLSFLCLLVEVHHSRLYLLAPEAAASTKQAHQRQHNYDDTHYRCDDIDQEIFGLQLGNRSENESVHFAKHLMWVVLQLVIARIFSPVGLTLRSDPLFDSIQPHTYVLKVMLLIDGDRRWHRLQVGQTFLVKLFISYHELLNHIDA